LRGGVGVGSALVSEVGRRAGLDPEDGSTKVTLVAGSYVLRRFAQRLVRVVKFFEKERARGGNGDVLLLQRVPDGAGGPQAAGGRGA
jgi:hypothetical protein